MAPEPKDIATLWSADNAIVNQKTNYYVAAMAVLTWPTVSLWTNGHPTLAAALAALGAGISVASFLSIARTAAFRAHWLRELRAASSEYADMFDRASFKWYERTPSNTILVSTPVLGCAVWLAVAGTLFLPT